jgi:hypothetical protein
MWLPMAHTLTRNRTYDAADKGKYQNIHIYKREQMISGGARFDDDFLWILPRPQPTTAPYTTFYGWHKPNSSTVDPFSGACWYFAQELTDIALTKNETAPILGLLQSAWGGSEIDDWIKNTSISACKNASGAPEPNRQGHVKGGSGAVYPNNGALWNGMVAPFLNMTIFGALWYQGENNVYECMNGVDPSLVRARSSNGGPGACGNILNRTGYACSTHNLVTSWREQWSASPSTTSASFPFGIVSLADGTSEGHGQNMANFRHAQTASYGFLPVRGAGAEESGLANTFIAQVLQIVPPTPNRPPICYISIMPASIAYV